MESEQLFGLENWKKNFQKLLKKYEQIDDIIIFGSAVKGRQFYKDIDIAIIFKGKKDITKEIEDEIIKIKEENIHVQILESKDIYETPLGKSIIMEGYSLKNEKFVREIWNIKPINIFNYSIKDLPQIKKVEFNRAINKELKIIGGQKIGAGSVMIPIQKSSEFEDFLSIWGNTKYTTKEWKAWLL